MELKFKELILSHHKAEIMVMRLIQASMWFEVTPIPDDSYIIKIKVDDFTSSLTTMEE